MKKVLLCIVIIVFQSCNNQQKRKIKGNSEFQIEMNSTFKDASKSPLTKNDLKGFKGLDFFKIDKKYTVEATLAKTLDSPIFNFPTTTDRVAVYKKYGEISFVVEGMSFKLSIYKDEFPEVLYEDYLFLPFFDKTNGNTTYEGGRYIDILLTDIKGNNKVIIDFNKAYNPYCAYNEKYSCPITPRDNYLDIEINAGVKAYKK